MTDSPPSLPAVPVLPDTATAEERDQHWFQHVYQGDRPQFTVRAVFTGGLLGMAMSAAHLYTSLKLGWGFGITITSGVLAWVMWKGIAAVFGGRVSPLTMLENNSMQSTASAAGYSTGTTLATACGALLLMTGNHLPWYSLVPFVFFSAALGSLLAVPLKRQMINIDQLPFPSGIAAAETTRSLYSAGAEAVRKAWTLIFGIAAGGLVGALRGAADLFEMLKWKGIEQVMRWITVPGEIYFPHAWLTAGRGKPAGFAFEPSLLLIGAGMITGLRVSLSMLLGGVILYFFLMPALLEYDAAHAMETGFNVSLPAKNGTINPFRWGVWGGSALMVFSSLTALAMQWKTLARSFTGLGAGGKPMAAERAAIEVPSDWLLYGLPVAAAGLIAVEVFAFGISLPLAVLAVIMCAVISVVCCRATGETDTTPTGAMGKVTQLLYAVLPGASGNAVVNLMAAGTTSAAGLSAADLLGDLKSGHLLGANPRQQFLAQFSGIFFGTVAACGFWYLMIPNKEALEKYNPPATNAWRATAELLTKGVDQLPHSALIAIFIGAGLGILLPVLEKLLPKLKPWLPSAMGLGLGFVVPLQNGLSFALGAVIAAVWQSISKRTAEERNVPLASGFIAGESLVSAFFAIGGSVAGWLMSN